MDIWLAPSDTVGDCLAFPDFFYLGLTARSIGNQTVADDPFEPDVRLALLLRVVLDRGDLSWAELSFGGNVALNEPFNGRVMAEVEETMLCANQQKSGPTQLANQPRLISIQ